MNATLKNGSVLVAKDEGYRVVLKWADPENASVKYPTFKPVENVDGIVGVLAAAETFDPEKYGYMGRFARHELSNLSMRTRNHQTKHVRAVIKNGGGSQPTPSQPVTTTYEYNGKSFSTQKEMQTYKNRVEGAARARAARAAKNGGGEIQSTTNDAITQASKEVLELLSTPEKPKHEKVLTGQYLDIYKNLVRMGELDEATKFFNDFAS